MSLQQYGLLRRAEYAVKLLIGVVEDALRIGNPETAFN